MTAYIVKTKTRKIGEATDIITQLVEADGPSGDIIRAKNGNFIRFDFLGPGEMEILRRLGLEVKKEDEVKIEL